MSRNRGVVVGQFERGFLLGMLYEKGHTLSTARIRKEVKASKATAKRDMQRVSMLVPVSEARPVSGMLLPIARVARKAA